MIYTVVGARPNFIKIDPSLPQIIIHTGQHFSDDMSGVFFRELGLSLPKYNLSCRGNQLGKMLDKLRVIFRREKPSLVLVFGDTHSSLAGALAAKYEGIKVVHVEAGMRSGNMLMPEEINRVAIDHVADVNFCVNDISAMNLAKEGIVENVFVVGDPMVDTMMRFMPLPRTDSYQKYTLITIHRPVNSTKEWLKKFLEILGKTDRTYLFPAHPRVKKWLKPPPNVKIMPPQSYKKMLILQSNAAMTITDSGGVQRESAWMNIPVLVMREETEWAELIASGKSKLSSLDTLEHDILTFKGNVSGAPKPGANKLIKERLTRYL